MSGISPALEAEKNAFREATDALVAEGVTLVDVAGVFGVVPNSLSRWRAAGDPRRPHPGWRADLASYARKRAEEMREGAQHLEAIADRLSDAAR